MIKNTEQEGLTRKELVEATGCAPYLIRYYTECGYLPMIKQSSGPGHPVVFHRDAISEIKRRMAQRSTKYPMDTDEHGTE